MTTIGRYGLSPFLVWLVALGANSAFAANICWVERVKRSGTGVEVYFKDDRVVRLVRANQLAGTFQTYSSRTTEVHQIEGAAVVEAVPAMPGDRLVSSNTPHDSCSMTVKIRNGRIGLEADASAQLLLDQPPMRAQAFIPAE